MQKKLPTSLYGHAHPTYADISAVEGAILTTVGGRSGLEKKLPLLLRECIDDAIDIPGMERFFITDLLPQEKANIGTRVEIALRDLIQFPKRKLDFYIANKDVDVKFTTVNNWMIPTEAVGHICILIAEDKERLLSYFGLLKADAEYLTKAGNKDEKVSVSAEGFKHIKWLLAEFPFPANFWRNVRVDQREEIFSSRGGTARLVKLFEMFQEVPINRSVIVDIGRQKDNLKRVRGNGGARDELQKRGISILSGKFNKEKIARLGLPPCDNDSFISTAREIPRD